MTLFSSKKPQIKKNTSRERFVISQRSFEVFCVAVLRHCDGTAARDRGAARVMALFTESCTNIITKNTLFVLHLL